AEGRGATPAASATATRPATVSAYVFPIERSPFGLSDKLSQTGGGLPGGFLSPPAALLEPRQVERATCPPAPAVPWPRRETRSVLPGGGRTNRVAFASTGPPSRRSPGRGGSRPGGGNSWPGSTGRRRGSCPPGPPDSPGVTRPLRDTGRPGSK